MRCRNVSSVAGLTLGVSRLCTGKRDRLSAALPCYFCPDAVGRGTDGVPARDSLPEAARLARALAEGGAAFEALRVEFERIQSETRILEDELREAATVKPMPSVHPELASRATVTGVATARGLLAPPALPEGRVVAAGHCGGRI